jgi:hypothetical protein
LFIRGWVLATSKANHDLLYPHPDIDLLKTFSTTVRIWIQHSQDRLHPDLRAQNAIFWLKIVCNGRRFLYNKHLGVKITGPSCTVDLIIDVSKLSYLTPCSFAQCGGETSRRYGAYNDSAGPWTRCFQVSREKLPCVTFFCLDIF